MDQGMNPRAPTSPGPLQQPLSDEPPSPIFEPTKPVTSPVLEALGERPFGRSAAETDEWTHTVPFGASPPSRPAPVEDHAYGSSPRLPSSMPLQTPLEDVRGGFSHTSPPISPRAGHQVLARSPPTEHHGLRAQLGTSPRGRPVSMPNHYFQGLSNPYYALGPPHSLRDGAQGSRSSSRKTDDYDFYAFDTLPMPSETSTITGSSVLLVSTRHTLYAYEVGTEALRYHGHIEGLRGKVLAAKILPVSTRRDKLYQLRPLVVVLVHGPYIPQQETEHESGINRSQHSEFDPSESLMQAMQTVTQGPASETQMQTTVEVYSLKERQHVATLYRSPILEAEQIPGERYAEPAPPFGALSIHVKGRFIVVASAKSGEVYMYAVGREGAEAAFRCIGKTWTNSTVRKSRSWSASSASAASEAEGQEAPTFVELPVISLSSRWLAITPPVASSKLSLNGTVLLAGDTKNPPGVDSQAPDAQPTVTCELDTPLEDSRINRVARDVAQEMLKGAQWVGAQGMQAWKNYWNRPVEPTPPVDITRPPRPVVQFPPTHGGDDARANQAPVVVSIVDLERLSEMQNTKPEAALLPVATFPLPDGCSHLSFSPSGLNLLTASAKGDVQYVWDLLRMVHPRHDVFASSTTITGPLVRQVARFTRVTQANILEVVWSEPRGEKLAVLTDRGTVHLHDISSSAFAWPPPRAKRTVQPSHKRTSDAASTASGWGATLSSMTGRAQPILAAARDTRIPSLSGLNISGAGAGAGRQGSKIMASGFSKSVGAATGTVQSLRHMGENRLHVSNGLSKSLAPGSVRWLPGNDSPLIAVVGDRKVRIHSVVAKADPRSKTGKRYSAVGLRLAEHALPALKDPEARLPCDGILLGGFWPPAPRSVAPPAATASSRGIRPLRRERAPLSFAELEPCAPFQPIHADRRVTLHVFAHEADLHLGPAVTPWAFGMPLPTQPVAAGAPPSPAPCPSADPFFPAVVDTDPQFVPRLRTPPQTSTTNLLDDDMDDDYNEDALGPIASIVRADGAERADGAGPAAITVATRPVRRKKVKRRVDAHGLDSKAQLGDGMINEDDLLG